MQGTDGEVGYGSQDNAVMAKGRCQMWVRGCASWRLPGSCTSWSDYVEVAMLCSSFSMRRIVVNDTQAALRGQSHHREQAVRCSEEPLLLSDSSSRPSRLGEDHQNSFMDNLPPMARRPPIALWHDLGSSHGWKSGSSCRRSFASDMERPVRQNDEATKWR